MLLNDKALIVRVCKVAGLLPVSAEMLSDAAVNITSWVSAALADSLSRDLDLGILNGTGQPQPDGIVAQADPVSGTSLTDTAGAAIAAIGEAGGTASTIALSPTAYAAELTAKDSQGRLMHPDGLPDLLGLTIVQVPALDRAAGLRCETLLPGPRPGLHGHPARRLPARRDDAAGQGQGERRGSGEGEGVAQTDSHGHHCRRVVRGQAVSTPDPVRAAMTQQADPADSTVLTDALTAAGVTIGADDHAAVQWIAGADAATVATVASWITAASQGGGST